MRRLGLLIQHLFFRGREMDEYQLLVAWEWRESLGSEEILVFVPHMVWNRFFVLYFLGGTFLRRVELRSMILSAGNRW